MKIHPQMIATVQMIERLRRARVVRKMEIRFDANGISRVWLDGIECSSQFVGCWNPLDTRPENKVALPN